MLMSWIYFSILAYFLWGIVSTSDKIIVSKFIKSAKGYLILISFAGLFVVLSIPFFNFRLPDLRNLILILLSGILYIYGLTFYLEAIAIEEVSRVIPLYQLRPIFVYFISVLTIGENFSVNDGIAFFLLVGGSFLISLEKIEGVFKLRKAFYLMIFANILLAIYYVITKYIFNTNPFWNSFVIVRIGSFLGGLSLMIFNKYRKEMINILQSISLKNFSMVLGNQFLNIGALTSITYSISMGSVSLINSLNGFHSIFVLINSLFLSYKFPNILKEDFRKPILSIKIVSIILILCGVYFI